MPEEENGRPEHLPPACPPEQDRAGDRLSLQSVDALDLSGLTSTQAEELRTLYAKGLLDAHRKAADLRVEVSALDAQIGSFIEQTGHATQAGAHATIAHAQTTATGRTEVIIGNTDRAASGRLSLTMAGVSGNALMVAAIIAAGLVIAAFVLRG